MLLSNVSTKSIHWVIEIAMDYSYCEADSGKRFIDDKNPALIRLWGVYKKNGRQINDGRFKTIFVHYL